MNSILDAFLQDDAFARSYRHEELIVDVTESIYKIMRQKDMNKSDLAKATGLSKARITKLLDGSANMTLKSISDIAFALGVTPKVFVDATEACYANTSHVSSWENSIGIGYDVSTMPEMQYYYEAA